MTDDALDLGLDLTLDPGRVEAEVERVFRGFRSFARDDAAYCVASAGCALLGDRAPAPARLFYESYKPVRPRRAEQALDDRAWFELLRHPLDDPYLTRVFECALPAVLRGKTRSLSHFGLRESEAATPARSSVAAVRALGTASFALGVPAPWIFLRPHAPGGLAHVPSVPVATVVGSALLSGQSLETLALLAGRHAAAYRSGYFVRVLCGDSVTELTALAAAALKAGVPSLAVGEETARAASELHALASPVRGALASITRAAELFTERGSPVEVTQWLRGAEFTAWRAGLLVAGDLNAVRAMLSASPELAGEARAQLFSDLATFATSEAYFELRRLTGLALFDDDSPRGASLSMMPEQVELDETDLDESDIGKHEPVARAPVPSVFPPAMGALGAMASALRAPRSPSAIARPAAHVTDAGEGTLDEIDVELDEDEPASAPQDDFDFDVDLSEIEAPREPGRITGSMLAAQEPSGSPSPTAKSDEPEPVPLGDDAWESLLHYTGAGGAMSELLFALAPHLRAARPRTPLDYGFDPQASREDHPLGVAVRRAARALGAAEPLVFVLDGHGVLLARPPCDPPITVVDPHEARVFDDDAGARLFLAAEHAAYFRRELSARVLTPSPSVLGAIVQLLALRCAGEAAPPDEQTDPYVRAVVTRALEDTGSSRMWSSWCGSLGGAAGALSGVHAWCDAAESAAMCAALVYAGDLAAAARVLQRDRGAPVSAPASTRVAMLEAFAHGPDYAALRKGR